MIDRKTADRIEAEDCIRAVFDDHVRSKAIVIRRVLRERFYWVNASRSQWYAALRSVTGGGVLDIKDRAQPELVDRGPRSKRKKGGRRAR